jgi:hypothetical protein
MDISGIGKKNAKKLVNPATSGNVSAPAEEEKVPSLDITPSTAGLGDWLAANTEPKLAGVGIREDSPTPEAAAEERGRINELNSITPAPELPTRRNKNGKNPKRASAEIPVGLRPSPDDDLLDVIKKDSGREHLAKMQAVAATSGVDAAMSLPGKGLMMSQIHAGKQINDDYEHFDRMHALINHVDNALDSTGLKLVGAGQNVGALRDLATAARNHVNEAERLHASGQLTSKPIAFSSSRSTGTGRGQSPEQDLELEGGEMDPTEHRALKHIMATFPLTSRGAGADDARTGVGQGGIFDTVPQGSAEHLFRAGQYTAQIASLLHQATVDIQDNEPAKQRIKDNGHEVPSVWNGHIPITEDVKYITDSYGKSVGDPNIMDRIAAGVHRSEATPEEVASVFQPQRDRSKNLSEAHAQHAEIARNIATQAYHKTFGQQLAARQTSYAARTAAWSAGASDRARISDAAGNVTDFSGVIQKVDKDTATTSAAYQKLQALDSERDQVKYGRYRDYRNEDGTKVKFEDDPELPADASLEEHKSYRTAEQKHRERTLADISNEENEAKTTIANTAGSKDLVPTIMASLKGHSREKEFQALADLHASASKDLEDHIANRESLVAVPAPEDPFEGGKFNGKPITRDVKNSDEYVAADAKYKQEDVRSQTMAKIAADKWDADRRKLSTRVDALRTRFIGATGFDRANAQVREGAPTMNMRGIPSLEDYISSSNIPTNLVQQRREDGSYYLGNEAYQGEGMMGGWKPATAEEAMKYVRNKYISPGAVVGGALAGERSYPAFPNMSKRNPVRFPETRVARTGNMTPIAVRNDNLRNLESATTESGAADTVARGVGGRLREALAGYYSGDPSRLMTTQAFQTQMAGETQARRDSEWNTQKVNNVEDVRMERSARAGDDMIKYANQKLVEHAPLVDAAEEKMVKLQTTPTSPATVAAYNRGVVEPIQNDLNDLTNKHADLIAAGPDQRGLKSHNARVRGLVGKIAGKQAALEEAQSKDHYDDARDAEISAHGDVLKDLYKQRDQYTALARTAQSDYFPMASGQLVGESKKNKFGVEKPTGRMVMREFPGGGGAVSVDRITGARTGDYGYKDINQSVVYGKPNLTFERNGAQSGQSNWWDEEEDMSDDAIARRTSFTPTSEREYGTMTLNQQADEEDKKNTGKKSAAGEEVKNLNDLGYSVGEGAEDDSKGYRIPAQPAAETDTSMTEAKARVSGVFNNRKRK